MAPRPPKLSFSSRSNIVASTQYTIDELGVDREVLQKTILKHCRNLDRFLDAKPVAAHTQEAFSTVQEAVSTIGAPIILDSGCGTGKSTLTLGKLYPNHTIIGVDRSLARLTKNGVYRDQAAADGETATGNVFFVRAELADFWRLWLQSSLNLPEKHFLLYPNPYPKKRRFQNRWYAHPAFPLVLQMKSQEIIIRSNWKAYLEDFAAAVALAEKQQPCDGDGDAPIAYYYYTATGPTEIDSAQSAWTNFEQKYFDVGETCYELVLDKK